MNYLLRSKADYADEFDVEGLLEISKDERDALIANSMLLSGDSRSDAYEEGEDDFGWEDADVYFGTNEGVYYKDIELVIVEVTDEELSTLKRVYGIDPNKKFKAGTLDLESYL